MHFAEISKNCISVQDVNSWRVRDTDEGLTGAVEFFGGNRAAEWAPWHMVMVMLGGGCGDLNRIMALSAGGQSG